MPVKLTNDSKPFNCFSERGPRMRKKYSKFAVIRMTRIRDVMRFHSFYAKAKIKIEGRSTSFCIWCGRRNRRKGDPNPRVSVELARTLCVFNRRVVWYG
jgi:hypothetical protein